VKYSDSSFQTLNLTETTVTKSVCGDLHLGKKALQVMNDFVNGKETSEQQPTAPSRRDDLSLSKADFLIDMFDRVVGEAVAITVRERKVILSAGAIDTA